MAVVLRNAGFSMRCKSNLLVSFAFAELTPTEQDQVKQAMERWNKSDLYKCPDLQKTYTRPELFYHQVVKRYGWGRV
ncbi:predicted protein [Methanosarcina acetivorans C2A]|uniref:Uncharacterized protein n=2 Tax=Methanosarcina acetivorans TaxID=2214 RepID=Q8TM67_METAC|nr:predicted protein [Methanosarcina acetivorans C2A]